MLNDDKSISVAHSDDSQLARYARNMTEDARTGCESGGSWHD
jgi:hypothetical protein